MKERANKEGIKVGQKEGRKEGKKIWRRKKRDIEKQGQGKKCRKGKMESKVL